MIIARITENPLNFTLNLTLNSSKTEFLIIGLKQQLSKIDNSLLNTTHSARNLGFIFDEHLTFSDQISSLSKSCYSHIRQLSCIRPYLDSKTASTIAASIVHSKLDYCKYNLPKSQINRLQQIQNSLARTVVKAPKSSLVTPILRSLHWLKINKCIEYKLLSLTYKVLTTSQPDYLHNLISLQSSGRTRSSSVVTLARPSVSLSLQITNRSFRYASLHLWNQLPPSFCQPHCVHSPPGSPHPTSITSSQSPPLLSLPLHFTPDLKLISFTNPFLHSHSYSFRTDFTDFNLYCIKGALALFVLVSFSGYLC